MGEKKEKSWLHCWFQCHDFKVLFWLHALSLLAKSKFWCHIGILQFCWAITLKYFNLKWYNNPTFTQSLIWIAGNAIWIQQTTYCLLAVLQWILAGVCNFNIYLIELHIIYFNIVYILVFSHLTSLCRNPFHLVHEICTYHLTHKYISKCMRLTSKEF